MKHIKYINKIAWICYIIPFTILLVSIEWLHTKYKSNMMIQFQGKMLFFIVSYFTIYIICWDIATGVELL